MNMFAKNAATSVEEYLANVPEDRKKDMHFLHDFIQKTVPSLKPNFTTNMIGYGLFQYLDSKKQTKNWPVISLANQKNYISIYVCSTTGEQYTVEKYAKELGKVSAGKSCINVKKIEDLNLDTLKTILQLAQQKPSLIGATIVEK